MMADNQRHEARPGGESAESMRRDSSKPEPGTTPETGVWAGTGEHQVEPSDLRMNPQNQERQPGETPETGVWAGSIRGDTSSNLSSGPNEGGGAWTTANEGRVSQGKAPEGGSGRGAEQAEGTYRGMAGSQAHGVVPTGETNVSQGMSGGRGGSTGTNMDPGPLPQIARGQAEPEYTPSQQGGQQYTVEEGDTLETIAARFYGSAAEWERIAEANEDKLGMNHLLYPGQELAIPGRQS